MKSETAPTDGDLSTATPAPSEDGIASTSATCQTGSADGDDDGFQTKIVELFPEVSQNVFLYMYQLVRIIYQDYF